MKLYVDRVTSPVGEIQVVSDGKALRALDFHDYTARMNELLRVHYGAVELVAGDDPLGMRARLERYFAGDFSALESVPLHTNGTAFQQAVWKALLAIPVGTTTSYGAIAKALGVPGSARAVGWANGSNPIAIVVPCHRVIGADGTLTGYGGGLPRKAWLLRHEGVHVPELGAQNQIAFAF
jgi:methylated-DNA-[protein]-cysteine S-methyltransferase